MRLYFFAAADDLPRLEDVVRAGLLHVDVLARLAAPDGLQRVLVVGSGDRDGVDRLILQQLAEVGEGRRLLLRGGFHLGGALGEDGFVHVAERRHLHVGQFAVTVDVIAAAPAQAHAGDAHGIVGARGRGAPERRSGRRRTHQEVPSIHRSTSPEMVLRRGLHVYQHVGHPVEVLRDAVAHTAWRYRGTRARSSRGPLPGEGPRGIAGRSCARSTSPRRARPARAWPRSGWRPSRVRPAWYP